MIWSQVTPNNAAPRLCTQYTPMLFTLYLKKLRWQFHWHGQKGLHGCKWISAGTVQLGDELDQRHIIISFCSISRTEEDLYPDK